MIAMAAISDMLGTPPVTPVAGAGDRSAQQDLGGQFTREQQTMLAPVAATTLPPAAPLLAAEAIEHAALSAAYRRPVPAAVAFRRFRDSSPENAVPTGQLLAATL